LGFFYEKQFNPENPNGFFAMLLKLNKNEYGAKR